MPNYNVGDTPDLTPEEVQALIEEGYEVEVHQNTTGGDDEPTRADSLALYNNYLNLRKVLETEYSSKLPREKADSISSNTIQPTSVDSYRIPLDIAENLSFNSLSDWDDVSSGNNILASYSNINDDLGMVNLYVYPEPSKPKFTPPKAPNKLQPIQAQVDTVSPEVKGRDSVTTPDLFKEAVYYNPEKPTGSQYEAYNPKGKQRFITKAEYNRLSKLGYRKYQTGGSLEKNTHIPFVDRIVNEGPVRPNPDGSVSTHLMSSAEVDGKNIAYPNLQYLDGQWLDFSHDPNVALDKAMRRGNVMEFKTPQEANEFAEGKWKEQYKLGGTLDIDESEIKRLEAEGYEFEKL